MNAQDFHKARCRFECQTDTPTQQQCSTNPSGRTGLRARDQGQGQGRGRAERDEAKARILIFEGEAYGGTAT